MLWRTLSRFRRSPPAGFIQPAQPTLVAKPRAGPEWIHEVKHDGYRLLAYKSAGRVVLWSRYGTDLTDNMPRIAAAVRTLPVDDALIDGEAVVFRCDGHSDFAALRTSAARPRPRSSPSIFCSLRARTAASCRSKSAGPSSRRSSPGSTPSGSARRSRPRARSSSPRPASSALRGSCRSAAAAPIGAAGRAIGSRSRTPHFRENDASL